MLGLWVHTTIPWLYAVHSYVCPVLSILQNCFITCSCVGTCMSVRRTWECTAYGGQMAWIPWSRTTGGVSLLMWVLGTERGFSVRTVCACKVQPSLSPFLTLLFVCCTCVYELTCGSSACGSLKLIFSGFFYYSPLVH